MRLLFVVHRYGPHIAGGAETYCRLLAEHLVERGHHVEVVTSCATSYLDWANEFAPGTTTERDVTVHRLPVSERRDLAFFGRLSSRVLTGAGLPPWHLQREWMRRQGPSVEGLVDWLAKRVGRGDLDAVNVVTYLYATTADALPVLAGRAPVILHPTAHDEPPLRLPLFDALFHLPDAFAFLTEEEAELVRRRFGVHQPGEVIGIGADVDDAIGGDHGRAFRRSVPALGDDPYLLCLGRVDASKGTPELVEWFGMYRLRQGRTPPLRLALVGDPVERLALPPDVVVTGVVDEALKRSAISGATALVQPSYFESFSMVLTETWAHGVPALVQGRSPVLAGHARRSGGALAYRGFAEFEAALDVLVADRGLRRQLAAAGLAYTRAHYTWDAVLGRYESLVARAAAAVARH